MRRPESVSGALTVFLYYYVCFLFATSQLQAVDETMALLPNATEL